jgi:hypothetical protein
MREHELDQILSKEENVVPSAKFTKSVMYAVRLEAAAPPPVTFPWLRALPGIAAGVFALMWIVIEGARLYEPRGEAAVILGSILERLTPFLAKAEAAGLRWILLALLVTMACVELTWRVSERRA